MLYGRRLANDRTRGVALVELVADKIDGDDGGPARVPAGGDAVVTALEEAETMLAVALGAAVAESARAVGTGAQMAG